MLRLVIGSKHLSSWSLRPWLLLRHLNLPFEEIELPLDAPAFHARIGEFSPAGRVPVLLDDALTVWDSLAICEHINELTGGAAWPRDLANRAHARAISAEMHAGFADLRECWSFRAGAQLDVALTPAAARDVERIEHIWQTCRVRDAAAGPWLFGEFSIADAMYAPVALRFATYGAQLSAGSRRYVGTVMTDQHVRTWIDGATAN